MVAKHGREGFTLIEILIVVVITGILAGMSQYGFRNMRENADNASMADNVHVVSMALERYADEHGGAYPASLVDPAFLQNYVPAKKLPAPPWCKRSQAVNIPLKTSGTLSTADWDNLLQAERLRNVPIGDPNVATHADPPAVITDDGAIAYEVTVNNAVFHLAGFGHVQGHRAVLAPCTNNAVGANAKPN